MVERQDSDDGFHDCADDVSQIQTNGTDALPNGEEVIQVTANDIEENKNFDMNAARAFTLQGVRLGAFSFSDAALMTEGESPPPKYLSDEVLRQPLPTNKTELLAGLIINEEGCLVCTDQEALDKQKGVLSNVAKQLAINLLKGLSISHISLPIKIFEGRSSI